MYSNPFAKYLQVKTLPNFQATEFEKLLNQTIVSYFRSYVLNKIVFDLFIVIMKRYRIFEFNFIEIRRQESYSNVKPISNVQFSLFIIY
jgi:hypothetical protein